MSGRNASSSVGRAVSPTAGRNFSSAAGQNVGAQRSRPASQYRRDSNEYYDSEEDNRERSMGSNKNLKQAILDKKMKEERDNRRFDDF
jgi:hypothetical protein